MPGRMLTTFSFLAPDHTGLEMAGFARGWLGFEPKAVSIGGIYRRNVPFEGEASLRQVESRASLNSLKLEGRAGIGGSFLNIVTTPEGALTVNWRLEEAATPPRKYLDELAGRPDFVAGYCVSMDDRRWQSESLVANYESFERPHDHLPKVKVANSQYEIDLRYNPGRWSAIPRMWLASAWRMWFGRHAFAYLPRERLITFPEARQVDLLPSGSVFIELYESAFECGLSENRARQHAFRAWMGMDELEAAALAGVAPQAPGAEAPYPLSHSHVEHRLAG